MYELPQPLVRCLRRHVGLRHSRCPVSVIAGESPPTIHGQPGHSEFKGGGECRTPRAAIAQGYKVYYVRSTQYVSVGDEWLAREWDQPQALAARLGLDPETPLGILADFAEERGAAVNVAALRDKLMVLAQ